ncbi:MAG TPA: HEAT repeat domain-containing protein, partial [Nitrospiria bacterium]
MEKDAQQVLKELQDKNPEVRLHAIGKLALFKDAKYIPYMIEMMADPEWRVRKTAVVAVAGLERNEPLAEQLLQVLYQEGNVGKRNAAEEALRLLGKTAVVPLLTHLRKANTDVKKMIIEALGEIGDKRAAPELRLMLEDPDENVRLAAIESLGKIKESHTVDALMPLLRSETPLIRFATVKALERLGDERIVDPLVRIAAQKGLERVVLEALGTFADPAVLAPILTGLREGTTRIKESALKALVDHSERVSQERKASIINHLRQAYDQKMALFLYGALEQSDEKLKSATVKVLGWMEDSKAAAPISKLIDGPLREEAIHALIRMKMGAVEILLQELPAANEVTREGIARILGEAGDRRYVNALIRLLADPNGHVRQTAALALARINDSSSAKAILDLLADQYISVQESAIQALSLLKNPAIVSRLIELLGSNHAVLRCNAIQVIGKMKAVEAIPNLSFCLKD